MQSSKATFDHPSDYLTTQEAGELLRLSPKSLRNKIALAAAVSHMRRTLVPGGRVVIGTPGAIQPTFEILERAVVEHINPDLGGFVRAVFSMHDPDGLASILRGAGLQDVTASVEQATLRLPGPAEFLWQYINLTPMAPIVAQAPEDAKQAMERDVVERWQPYVDQGGALAGGQPMVIATGWK